MLLHKFENKYIVKGTLVNITPIHIGGGNDGFHPLQSDGTVIRDNKGMPYIPGSSLKGVLRSYIETLINSGISSDYEACFIVNKPCVDNEEIKYIKKEHKEDELKIATEIYNRMCDVCKIFGGNQFASKLKIRDSKLIGDTFFIDRRDGIAIDRETGTSLYGAKYEFEQVAKGTEFEFYMTIDNLEKKHEDFLKIIVNALKIEDLYIGGKTSVGLGNVKLEQAEVYKITSDKFKQYLMNGLSDEMRWENV